RKPQAAGRRRQLSAGGRGVASKLRDQEQEALVGRRGGRDRGGFPGRQRLRAVDRTSVELHPACHQRQVLVGPRAELSAGCRAKSQQVVQSPRAAEGELAQDEGGGPERQLLV